MLNWRTLLHRVGSLDASRGRRLSLHREKLRTFSWLSIRLDANLYHFSYGVMLVLNLSLFRKKTIFGGMEVVSVGSEFSLFFYVRTKFNFILSSFIEMLLLL